MSWESTPPNDCMDFEELDYCPTPLGALSLRRRMQLPVGVEVFEVKLDEAFLMSSLFTQGEIALARLGLAGLGDGPLDVVVGGLGLGYTAQAVLEHAAVHSVVVVEAVEAVVQWHRRGLVPLGPVLTADTRCTLLNADFFARVADSNGIDPAQPGKRFDAILVDIDHSPRALLNERHQWFYQRDGLRRLAMHLQPHGVFALWSNDPPDEDFLTALRPVFSAAQAHVVRFHNPLQNREASNTVYVARAPALRRAE